VTSWKGARVLLSAAAAAGTFVCVAASAQAPSGQAPAEPPGGPGPARPAQTPAFRTGIELVSLNVTVTDASARFVTDLERDDFSVFEDGVKQDITFFNKSTLPIALALMLDTSASMETKLPVAQEAAIGFVRRLRPQDLAEVIDFDSRVTILAPFTADAAELEQAIRKTSAGGSTSLYNAVYIALKDLKKLVARNVEEIRRRAIVLLSDGEDTSSLLPYEEVLDLAKRSETAIYSIGLRSSDPIANRGFKEAEFELRQLAQETGGRAFFINSVGDLAKIYGEISEELSSQYTLGYVSKNQRRDGAWRRVVVRINGKPFTARTKQGYFAPAG